MDMPACEDREGTGAPAAAPDGFLDGRLSVLQPPDHARASIDAVFLAAAVPAVPGERALELGSGTGVASLCLAWRVPGLAVEGLERLARLGTLACESAALNRLDDRVRFTAGDLRRGAMRGAGFDHVLMNPPYHEAGATRPSPVSAKALAHAELAGGLADWVEAGLGALRRGGMLTVVHRVERLGALLALLDGRAGAAAIFPLWPAQGRPAKRILVRARKGSSAPSQLLPGLVLHNDAGRFTAAAEAVLRSGVELNF
jgi:tRNA1(Val) A37 N6-methylase TrmN6